MNPQQLHILLQATIQADQNARIEAEKILKSIETHNGFLSSLLQLAVGSDSTAQAAAIYFKNRVRCWETLPAEDKEFTKNNILEAISHSSITRSILLASAGLVISYETKSANTWPELLPTVSQLLTSQDLNVLFTGLTVLLEIIKSWQWYTHEKVTPINSIISNIFPSLLEIAEKIEKNRDSVEALFLLKCIVKIFCYANRIDLSKELMEPSKFVPWASLFISMVEWRWTQESTSIVMPINDEGREKHIYWKCKKWAFRNLNSFMGRYAIARKKDKKYSNFSKIFLQEFAPKVLGVYMQQIESNVKGEWISDRVKQFLFSFLEYCIKPSNTWNILQNHLEALVLHFIFPQLSFSKTDFELWEEDPVEYVQKKIDPPIEDFKSPVTAAADFLAALVKNRTSITFIPILTLINNLLTNSEGLDPVKKYGLFSMMGILSESALQDMSIHNQMETFLVTHVFHELNNPSSFLKAKACDLITEYTQVQFQDISHLHIPFENVVKMINDSELPVRVSAALALGPFLKYPELASALKPHVVSVMQGLLQITNEIDLDTLSSTMELLVFEFSSELKPFATQLASQLAETFMRIMNENNFSSDDVDFDKVEEKTMAAMGILKTLDALVLSVETSPEIVLDLEIVISPILLYVLDNSILDLFEETFELIGTCLFCVKQVSSTMWTIFPRIYNTFKMDSLEYLAEMLPSLDNYIAYGKDVFLHDIEKQNQLMDIIYTVMNDKDSRESDRIRGIQLIESLLLNLRGQIDPLIPKFIEIAYRALCGKIKSAPFRVHCIEVVVNSIYYNPILALQLLEHINWTGPFFEIWFNNLKSLHRVHDKKLTILAICSLLELPIESLPKSLAPMWTHLFEGMLTVFSSYLSALKERAQMDSGEYEDEDYSDFDENGVLDDDHDSEFVDEEENIEALIQDASAYAPNSDDDDDESDDDLWDVEEFLQEDTSFVTLLDRADAFASLKQTMSHLISTGQASILESKLNPDQKSLLQSCLSKSEANASEGENITH